MLVNYLRKSPPILSYEFLKFSPQVDNDCKSLFENCSNYTSLDIFSHISSILWWFFVLKKDSLQTTSNLVSGLKICQIVLDDLDIFSLFLTFMLIFWDREVWGSMEVQFTPTRADRSSTWGSRGGGGLRLDLTAARRGKIKSLSFKNSGGASNP